MNNEQLGQFNTMLDNAYSEIGSVACAQSVPEDKAEKAMALAAEVLRLATELGELLK